MPLQDVRVPALDRGFLFGDSVYEVIRVYNMRPVFLDRHMSRLQKSLDAIFMATDIQSLTARLQQLASKSAVNFGYAYVQITRGSGPRKHLFPNEVVAPNELIFIQPMDEAAISQRRENGFAVITLPDMRWKRPDIKSNNLLPNCLAQQQAFEADADEAILFNERGFITEGTASNVFAIVDDTLVTPPVESRILAGVTREIVLELANSLGISTVERPVSLEELPIASEMFATSTTCDVTPIVRVDGDPIGNGSVGSITAMLQCEFKRMLDDALPISNAA